MIINEFKNPIELSPNAKEFVKQFNEKLDHHYVYSDSFDVVAKGKKNDLLLMRLFSDELSVKEKYEVCTELKKYVTNEEFVANHYIGRAMYYFATTRQSS